MHRALWLADFSRPETWLGAHLDTVRGMMQQPGGVKRIWITEVGAPVNDNPDLNGFFGYPSTGVAVKGQTREANVSYMIKMYVLALSMGVEKVFWYNYRDWGSDVTAAEDHFGLVDYWGFPKPAYAAYAQLIQRLDGKQYNQKLNLMGGLIQAYEFVGEHEDCFVLWTYPESRQQVTLDSLRPGLTTEQVVSVTSAVGSPVALLGAELTVMGTPVFVVVRSADSGLRDDRIDRGRWRPNIRR